MSMIERPSELLNSIENPLVEDSDRSRLAIITREEWRSDRRVFLHTIEVYYDLKAPSEIYTDLSKKGLMRELRRYSGLEFEYCFTNSLTSSGIRKDVKTLFGY